MAEFCLECFNEEFDEKLTKRDVVLREDLCEGCGKLKPCVVSIRSKFSIFRIFRFFQ